jgi:hypothetical protein
VVTPGYDDLAELVSIVDVVQCAVEIQQVPRAKNAIFRPSNLAMSDFIYLKI